MSCSVQSLHVSSARKIWILYYATSQYKLTMYVDAAYCYRPSSVLCRSVCMSAHAKAVEPIEFGFRLEWAQGTISRWGMDNFEGGGPL